MICTKFDLNWPAGSGELPMYVIRGEWMGWSFGWNRKNWGIVSHQVWQDKRCDTIKKWVGTNQLVLSPFLKERGHVSPPLSKKIFKNFQCIFTLIYYLPLKKGVALHMNNSEFPSPKDDLCRILLQLAQRFWRSRKCKSLRDRRHMSDGERVIRKTHLSFQLRWVKIKPQPKLHVLRVVDSLYESWNSKVNTKTEQDICVKLLVSMKTSSFLYQSLFF
jgi:hypothetical protein